MKRKKSKSNQPVPEQGVSRRDFLRGAGVAVSGSLLAGEGLLKVAPAAESTGKVVGPGAVPFTLRVNGKPHAVTLEPRVTLLDALRNHLDLTGAKRVCDRGTCGACTVMLDGKTIYSCSTLAIEAQGREITTIEGLAPEGKLTPVMQAFVDNDAQQCGFCTPGFVMAATALLKHNGSPSAKDIQRGLGGNLCRCGTYHGQTGAVLQAAKAMKTGVRG
ncbi:MAG TPA: (2Fe-2S)-binding protein [Terriglobia bacterium]|nr:(2Fe-2S)-binding protein [Terriglobia bacterium]